MAWVSVDAVDGGTAGSGLALVTGRIERAEIRASDTLHQVAADRSHVSQLGRRAFQQRFHDQRLLPRHQWMVRDVGHPGDRADNEPIRLQLDAPQGQLIDVDESVRPFDFLAHEIDQRGAACKVACAGSDGR